VQRRLGPGPRRVARPLLAAIVLLALSVARSSEVVDSQESPSVGVVELTPLVASALAVPQPVLGADDRVHLPYELLVMNVSPSMMQIDAVDTLDVGSQNRVVATLAGPALADAVRPFVQIDGAAIGPAQVSRVFLDLSAPAGATLPARIAHRFSLTLTPTGGTATTATVVSGITDVGQQVAVALDPPLAGSRWVAAGGCCFPPTPHRLATLAINGAIHVPERFAIDFIRLSPDGRMFSGPQTDLASYAFYGVPIYSVADGVVVAALDGLPEQTPGSVTPFSGAENAGGNYVVADIGNGRFAFYAHMQTGSVRVRVGDVVARGQVLGLLGNTGNSDAPHLHFHVMDGPIPLASNGLPFVFRSFSSEGTVTSSVDDLAAGHPAVIGPALAGRHENQMPLDDQVVDFAPLGAAAGDAPAARVTQ
jgi:murein DD-endopeptidase MepM/ murein hydrolase activator NlpD